MAAEVFRHVFFDEFKRRAAIEGPTFAALWHAGGSAWTSLMVHSSDESSVLERTVTRWAKEVATEVSLHRWYTIDLIAVAPPFKNGDYWHSKPVVLVEHENAKDVETETWKLAYWRAPLKVLVFYLFENNNWLNAKVEAIKRIVESSQASSPEENVEYLLMAGCRIGGALTWRSWARGEAWIAHEDYPTNIHVG